jgi:chemotaxis protein MotB
MGIREDQVTQVRGFADQRLRRPQDPMDPSNRRISLIVQYLQKPPELPVPKSVESPETPGAKPASKPDGDQFKSAEQKSEKH